MYNILYVLFIVAFILIVVLFFNSTYVKEHRQIYKLLTTPNNKGIVRLSNYWCCINNISIIKLFFMRIFTLTSEVIYVYDQNRIVGVVLWKRDKKTNTIHLLDVVFKDAPNALIKITLGSLVGNLARRFPNVTFSIECRKLDNIMDILSDIDFQEVTWKNMGNFEKQSLYTYYAK